MKKITAIIILAMSIMLLGACGTKTESGSSKSDLAKDTFVVGMECAYAPFNWTQIDNSNGAVAIQGSKEFAGGYDVEIAKKIAEGLGKELVIVKTDWEGLGPALISGKIDAVIAGMSPTPERKESIDFTDYYYESDLVMVVKKGGAFESATKLSDFAGAKITAQLNTFHYSVIDQIVYVDKLTASDNFATMRVSLESGSIDGYVSERPEGISASAANPNFFMVEFEDGFETSPDDTAVAVGVRKGSDLTSKINEVLADISKEERIEIMESAILSQPAAE